MIRYALRCDHAHRFDSWFGSSADFDRLATAGLLVLRGLRQSSTRREGPDGPERRRRRRRSAPLSAPASPAEQALAELRRRIEAQSEDVGRNFATEARRIHEGARPRARDHRRGPARPRPGR